MDRWNKTHCDLCGEKVTKGEGIYAIGGFYHNDTCYIKHQQSFIDSYDGEEIDSEYEKEMICPYCGYENTDSFEFIDEGEGVRICGRCGRDFEFTVNVSITYSTKKR
jgi:DNA-directed RNA polymerase subunit RPC12/RpoP